ncbi:hypothetical protein [Desulfofalx alkaliphila]|uniref:hypothetical protein n=1 Tax=Desulfofalx alkaliphila TaxID=105483 RepID=UPI0004E0CB0D|nr:hypothetical protein [Desulfofalx alkaliphila]
MTFIPYKVKTFKGYCEECTQAFAIESDIEIKVDTDLINESNYQDIKFHFEATNISVDNIVVLQNNKVVTTGTLDLKVTPYLEEKQSGETQEIINLLFLGLIEYPDILPTDLVNVQDYENVKFNGASCTETTFDAENGTLTISIQAGVNICVILSLEELINVNAANLSWES